MSDKKAYRCRVCDMYFETSDQMGSHCSEQHKKDHEIMMALEVADLNRKCNLPNPPYILEILEQK